MYKYISNSEDNTKKIAYKLASKLRTGDVVLLVGDLGAGKTKFVEGFLSFWNLQNEVSSPTFTIVNEYSAGRTNIYHFDVYRLESEDEFYEIGGLEYFENGISLIEWGNLIQDIVPKGYLKISFEKDLDDPNLRTITFESGSKDLENSIKEIFS